MLSFDPTAYGSATARILSGEDLCELGPGKPREERREELRSLRPGDVVSAARDQNMAKCCLSGLWLWHNFLDESHQISQEIGSSSGSYWHGIMHRREPDYSNSKYWYRRVGEHAIFPALQEAAAELARGHQLSGQAAEIARGRSWDPYAFVDLCSSVAGGGSADESFARQVATAEWQLLYDYCYHEAK